MFFKKKVYSTFFTKVCGNDTENVKIRSKFIWLINRIIVHGKYINNVLHRKRKFLNYLLKFKSKNNDNASIFEKLLLNYNLFNIFVINFCVIYIYNTHIYIFK